MSNTEEVIQEQWAKEQDELEDEEEEDLLLLLLVVVPWLIRDIFPQFYSFLLFTPVEGPRLGWMERLPLVEYCMAAKWSSSSSSSILPVCDYSRMLSLLLRSIAMCSSIVIYIYIYNPYIWSPSSAHMLVCTHKWFLLPPVCAYYYIRPWQPIDCAA